MMKELCIILVLINVITFLTYGIDKWKTQHGKWRISEATLLINPRFWQFSANFLADFV